jgi:hypothetical protein
MGFGSYGRDDIVIERNEQHFLPGKEEKLTALNNKIIYSYHAQHYAQSLITKL